MLSHHATLPQDTATLQVRLTAMTALPEGQTSATAQLEAERDRLRAERDALQSAHETAIAKIEKPRLMIRQLVRAQYGRSSEKLDPADQLQPGLEEREQSIAAVRPADGPARPQPAAVPQRKPAPRSRRTGRVTRLSSMSRRSIARAALHVVGEGVSEMLGVVPALYRVKMNRR